MKIKTTPFEDDFDNYAVIIKEIFPDNLSKSSVGILHFNNRKYQIQVLRRSPTSSSTIELDSADKEILARTTKKILESHAAQLGSSLNNAQISSKGISLNERESPIPLIEMTHKEKTRLFQTIYTLDKRKENSIHPFHALKQVQSKTLSSWSLFEKRLYFVDRGADSLVDKIATGKWKAAGIRVHSWVGSWFYDTIKAKDEKGKTLYLNKENFLKFTFNLLKGGPLVLKNDKQAEELNLIQQEKINPEQLKLLDQTLKVFLKTQPLLNVFTLTLQAFRYITEEFQKGEPPTQLQRAKDTEREDGALQHRPWDRAAVTKRKGIELAEQYAAKKGWMKNKQWEALGKVKWDPIFEKEFPKDPDLNATKAQMLAKRFTPNLNLKTAAHIVGDTFIGASGLEGDASLTTMNQIKNYLDRVVLVSHDYSEETIAKLRKRSAMLGKAIEIEKERSHLATKKQAEPFASLVTSVLSDLKKLPVGESYLLPVGWTSSLSGHAVYLDISKNLQDQYTVKVFNSGAGIRYHHKLSDQRLYDPCLEINHIPGKNLGSGFLTGLFEMCSYVEIPGSREETNYSEVDLYERLLLCLGGNVAPHMKAQFQPQINGICTYEGLMVMLREGLEEKEGVRLTRDLELRTLTDIYCDYPEPEKLSQNRTAARLLKKGVEKFARSFLRDSSFFTNVEQQSVHNVISLLRNHAKEAIRSDRYQKNRAALPMNFDSIGPISPLQMDLLSTSKVEGHYDFSPIHSLDIPWKSNWQPQIDKIELQLQNFREACEKAIENQGYDQAIFSIHELFLHLPLPGTSVGDSFWNQLKGDKKKIIRCMNEITKMSELIMNHIENSRVKEFSEMHKDTIICVYKGLALQHKLADLSGTLDKELEGWAMPYQDLEVFMPTISLADDEATQILKRGDNNIYDGKWRHELQGLLAYFKKQEGNDPIFHEMYKSWSGDGYADVIIEREKDVSGAENTYIHQFIQENRSKFCEAFPSDAQLDRFEWIAKARTDLKGDFLPVEFCLLKKQALVAHYVNKAKKTKLDFFIIKDAKAIAVILYKPFSTDIPGYSEGAFTFSKDSITDTLANHLALAKTFEAIRHFKDLGLKADKLTSENRLQELISLNLYGPENAFSYPHELQITRVFSYFSTHLELLEKGPYQVFVKTLLLQKDYLSQILRKNPEFSLQIVSFMDAAFQKLFQDKKTQGCLFLLNLKHLLEEEFAQLLQNPDIRTESLTNHLQNASVKMDQVLPSKATFNKLLALYSSPEGRSLVYRQWMANFSTRKNLTNEEIADLLLAAIYLKANPITPQFHDVQLHFTAHKALLIHAEQIKTFSKDIQLVSGLANQAVAILLGSSAGIQWKFTSPQLAVGTSIGKNESYSLHLSDLSLYQDSKRALLLPLAITEDQDFKLFCPMVGYEATLISPGVYEFKDTYGFPTRIFQKGALLTIQKQLKGGTWYELITSKLKKREVEEENFSPFGSKVLLADKSHWMACDKQDEILIYDANKFGGKPSYTVALNKTALGSSLVIQSIKREDRLPALLLSPIYKNNTPYESLKNFENTSYIHVWEDSTGKSKILEFPRLGLEFNIVEEKGGRKAYSVQYPGFYIAHKPSIQQLGDFQDFIVLEKEAPNGRIERKVLIPKKQIGNKGDKISEQGSISTKIYLGDSVNQYKVNYLTYQLDTEEHLKSSTQESNLFLAYLLSGGKKYHQAQSILRKYTDKINAYSSEEIQVFTWISELISVQKDTDPQSLAVFLTSASLLLSNLERGKKSSFTLPKNFQETIRSAYLDYIKVKEHVGSLALKSDEEQVIIKELSSLYPADGIESLKNRPDQLAVVPGGIGKKYEIDPGYRGILEKLIQNESQDKPIDHNGPLITRYSKATINNLAEYYQIAKEGSVEERERLEVMLRMKKRDIKSSDVEAIHFLLIVNSNPDLFPSLEELRAILKDKVSSLFEEKIDMHVKTLVRASEVVEFQSDLQKIKQLPTPMPPSEEVLSPFKIRPLPPFDPYLNILSLSSGLRLEDVLSKAQSKPALSQTELDQFINSLTAKAAPGLELTKFQELSTEIHAYNAQSISIHYQFKDGIPVSESIAKIKQILATQKGELSKLKGTSELYVMTLANRPSDSVWLQNMQQIERMGSKTSKLTLDELEVLFLQEDRKGLKERNPNLTDADSVQLKRAFITYLVQSTHLQSIERALKTLEDVEVFVNETSQTKGWAPEQIKADVGFQELVNTLGQALTSKKSYDPSTHLEYLLFEFHSHMQLRQDQIDNLERMQRKNSDLKLDKMILQAIMGSGKTAALTPILALSRADGDNLSIIVGPESLIQVMLGNMQESARNIYQQKIRTIEIDRDTSLTIEKLNSLLEQIDAIRRNRHCLIMTSKSLQCLSLKFQEMLFELDYSSKLSVNEELISRLELFGRLLNRFKTKGQVLIDEADLILNCRFKTQFTKGIPQPLDPNRYEQTCNLFNCLLNDPHLTKLVQLDFQQNPTLSAPPYSEGYYHATVKPALAKSLIHHSQMQNTNAFGLFYKALPNADKIKVEQYIVEEDSAGEAFVSSLKEAAMKDLLANLKEQLNKFLPLTLSKRCNVHYGFSQNPSQILAIPYRGNNNPVETSRFGNPYELLDYTVELYCKMGVPAHQMQKTIEGLQEKAKEERECDPSLKNSDTVSYKELQWLCDNYKDDLTDLLLNCHEADAARIANKLNKTRDHRFFNYVKRYVLSEIRFQPETLSNDSLDLVEMFNGVQGFTGTPWNAVTYHPDLITEKAVGVDGKTLTILNKNSKDNIQLLHSSGYPEVLNEFIHAENLTNNFRAHIDLGSLFTGIDNGTLAKEILKRITQIPNHPVKGVIFFDQNNEIMILEKGKKDPLPLAQSQLKPDECYTYYDQRHTTGADIKQISSAKATVSIGKDSTLRDLLQAVWRMRGLAQAQKVQLQLSTEAQQLLRSHLKLAKGQPITYTDIIQFVYKNEIAQLQGHIISFTQQKIGHTVKKLFNEAILKKIINGDLQQVSLSNRLVALLKEIKPVLINISKDQPFESYGRKAQLVNASQEIQLVQDLVMGIVKKIPDNSSLFDEKGKAKVLAELQITMAKGTNLTLLPAKLPSRRGELEDVESEVELEQEQETQTELEKEIYAPEALMSPMYPWICYEKSVKVDPKLFSKDFFNGIAPSQINMNQFIRLTTQRGPPILSIGSVLSEDPKLSLYFDVFDAEILSTFNYLRPVEMGDVSKAPLFSRQQLPDPHYLIVRDTATNKLKMLFLDNAGDVGYLYTALTEARKDQFSTGKGPREVELYLYDANLGVIQHSEREGDKTVNEAFKANVQLHHLITQTKFFLGKLGYTSAEMIILKAWILKKGVDRMENLFKNEILKWHPRTRNLYENSALKALFAECRKESKLLPQ